jgi:hypothetical protein
LTAALGGNVTPASVAALTAGLSDDTLRGAAAWMPQLAVDHSGKLHEQSGGMLSPRRGVSMLEPLSSMPTPLRGEGMPLAEFGPGGAWFRDDATLSIRYRPAAHADPVLVNWLQLVTRPDLPTQPIRDAVFKELADPAAPGLCVSCHSVEQIPGRALTVNWRSYDRRSESRPFTKFSHGPHLLLPQLADCTECHTIVNAADRGASYIELDPHQHVTEFKMMPRPKCAECHTPSAAGDRCQSCHNYHVGSGVFNSY